jgi:2,3-bisphosphoglycerate-independent phosphoglycerate mutase
MTNHKFDRIALLILDGWGLGPNPEVSAIAQANTPFMDSLYPKYPHTELVTYGEAVGLPEGQMGNSEVGHINIGAGRVVYQELARINKAIREGSFQQNQVLLNAMKKAKTSGKKLHLLGLVSDGGVHSHINHLKALCDMTEAEGLSEVFIHAFMDGRDTDPKGGVHYLTDLQAHLEGKSAKIASIIGRYYAMDRDKRWERIKKAYDLMISGIGQHFQNPVQALVEAYAAGFTDEFIEPHIAVDDAGSPLACISEDDIVICYNFRTDRCREITEVLTQKEHPEAAMHPLPLHYLTLTRYDETFKNISVVYEKDDLKDTLGEVLSKAEKTQIRIAETEKYPHVTFFFNGGREEPFEGEKRIIVPSPKVATYDLQPEMNAPIVTQKILAELESSPPDFLCLNYANADMVGHTGVFSAAVKAAEAVNNCVEKLVVKLLQLDYGIIIIADHGNSDFMVNEDGSPNTAHTMNPVPCIFVANNTDRTHLKPGKLADIAPTILQLMGIEIPKIMDGEILVAKD